MNLLSALFAGAKAVLQGIVEVGRLVVREVLEEFDRSAFGQAATRVLHGFSDRAFSQARDLAGEERELVHKYVRDGRRSEKDAERLTEIRAQQEKIKKDLEANAAAEAARELQAKASAVRQHEMDDDEVSGNVSVMSTKRCECGGVMTLGQGPLQLTTQSRKFYWQCTDLTRNPLCKRVYFDPLKERATIVRPPDIELDMGKTARRDEWAKPDVIRQAHARLRGHLEDEDREVVCPRHVLPMRLIQRRSGGRLLDSYEYVCLGVSDDGSSCTHAVPVLTMPQVSSILKRTEGAGILK